MVCGLSIRSTDSFPVQKDLGDKGEGLKAWRVTESVVWLFVSVVSVCPVAPFILSCLSYLFKGPAACVSFVVLFLSYCFWAAAKHQWERRPSSDTSVCLTQGAGGGVCVCVLTGLGFNPHRDCVCTNVDPSEKTACLFFFFFALRVSFQLWQMLLKHYRNMMSQFPHFRLSRFCELFIAKIQM